MNSEKEQPPFDFDSEAAVLGAMVMDEQALYTVLGMVREEDFYKPAHRLVYRAAKKLAYAGETPDTVMVMDELNRQGQAETVGGAYGLAKLTEKVASVTNVEAYCGLVVEKARLRRLLTACATIKEMVHGRQHEAASVIEDAESLIFDLGSDRSKTQIQKVGEGWEPEHERMAELAVRGRAPGLSTGFSAFDAYTGGLHAGKLYVVAARPSVGKSAWALNICMNVAKAGTPVGLFSLEMSKEELRGRIVSNEASIDSMALTTGIVRKEHLDRYADTMRRLKNVPLYINDDSNMHLGRMISTMRLLVRKNGAKVLMVDYLQLLTIVGFKGQRAEEVAKISRALKNEAKKLGVAVVALCQVNRESEKAGSKDRIHVWHLRESGSIEQDADVIALMQPDQADDSQICVYVDKNRGGPKGNFWLNFEAPNLRFINHIPQRSEEE